MAAGDICQILMAKKGGDSRIEALKLSAFEEEESREYLPDVSGDGGRW